MTEHVFDVADFRVLFPAFADTTSYPDDTLSAYWDRASVMICPYDNWLISNGKLQYALDLLTAHIAAMATQIQNGNGAGGPIQSATEGSVSVSMLAPPVKDFWQFWLSKTPYGQELLSLLEAICVGGFYFGGSPEGSAIRDVGGLF